MSYFDTCVNFKAIGSMSTWRLDNEDHLKKLSGKVTFFKNSSLHSRDAFPALKKDDLMWVVNYCNKFDASNCLNGSSELSASEMHLSKLYIDINLVKVTKLDGNAIFFDVFKGHTVDESAVLSVLPYESEYHCKANFAACENESKWSDSADFETMLQAIPKCEILDSPMPQTDEERDNSLDHEDSSSQPASSLSKYTPNKLEIPEKPKENEIVKQELKSNSLTCTVCSKSFSVKKKLQEHIRRHELHHRCKVCEESFENKRVLNRHIDAIHDTKEKRFYCDLCNKISKSKTNLKRHIEIHMDNRRVNCPTCGKILASKRSLYVHIKSFHENQPYHCDICNKILYSRTNLVAHMIIHNRTTMKHQCSTCGKLVKNLHNLDRHIKYFHTNERPFECSICKHCFVTKYELQKHLLRHTGEKPYCCELCGARFTADNSLKEHLRRHRGEKPFKCNICGKAFSGKSDWRKHIRTHNRVDP